MPGEPIKLRRTGGTSVSISAYLVECQSWGGLSGAPCFWSHPYEQFFELPDPRQGKEGETLFTHKTQATTALLGLVSGNWDIAQTATTVGDILREITDALNTGIAVVTPANEIRDLLYSADVIEDRRRPLREGS